MSPLALVGYPTSSYMPYSTYHRTTFSIGVQGEINECSLCLGCGHAEFTMRIG
jgi:hypothetical protein